MKNLFKKVFILLAIVSVAGTAYAVKSKELRLAVDADQIIIGNNIDSAIHTEQAKIMRFVDGKNVCYVAYTKVNSNLVNTSISCVN